MGALTPVMLARLVLSAAAALAVAWWVEAGSARRGVLPPGFRDPGRRWIARLALAGVLWVGIFLPLGMIGSGAPEVDLSTVATPRLFLLHGLLVASVLVWMLAGFAGIASPAPPAGPAAGPAADPIPGPDPGGPLPDPLAPDLPELAAVPGDPLPPPAAPPPPPLALRRRIGAQLGFVTPQPGREIGIGLVLGVGAWVAVLAAIVAIAGLLYAVGGQRFLPKAPPQLIPFVAGLPFLVRLLLSLSAGVVEETFFRGFLQPRVGILLSTALFALAHASYGQPFMLVGITILSLIYGLLVRWRQNIWPAIAAHALFDGVQLLIVIPAALKLIGPRGVGGVAALLGMG